MAVTPKFNIAAPVGEIAISLIRFSKNRIASLRIIVSTHGFLHSTGEITSFHLVPLYVLKIFGIYRVELYDVLPSLASLYIDVFVASNSSKDKTEVLSKRLYGWLNFELNERCLKTALLEVSTCTSRASTFLLPILRKTLLPPPPKQSFMDYLLHLTVLRRWALVSSDLSDIVQLNLNVKAPKNFTGWLRSKWPRAEDYLPQDKSLKGRRVTELLCNLDKQAVEELIDVFSQCLVYAEREDGESKALTGSNTSVVDLFMIDKTGNELKEDLPRKKRKVEETKESNDSQIWQASQIKSNGADLEKVAKSKEREAKDVESSKTAKDPDLTSAFDSVLYERAAKVKKAASENTNSSLFEVGKNDEEEKMEVDNESECSYYDGSAIGSHSEEISNTGEDDKNIDDVDSDKELEKEREDDKEGDFDDCEENDDDIGDYVKGHFDSNKGDDKKIADNVKGDGENHRELCDSVDNRIKTRINVKGVVRVSEIDDSEKDSKKNEDISDAEEVAVSEESGSLEDNGKEDIVIDDCSSDAEVDEDNGNCPDVKSNDYSSNDGSKAVNENNKDNIEEEKGMHRRKAKNNPVCAVFPSSGKDPALSYFVIASPKKRSDAKEPAIEIIDGMEIQTFESAEPEVLVSGKQTLKRGSAMKSSSNETSTSQKISIPCEGLEESDRKSSESKPKTVAEESISNSSSLGLDDDIEKSKDGESSRRSKRLRTESSPGINIKVLRNDISPDENPPKNKRDEVSKPQNQMANDIFHNKRREISTGSPVIKSNLSGEIGKKPSPQRIIEYDYGTSKCRRSQRLMNDNKLSQAVVDTVVDKSENSRGMKNVRERNVTAMEKLVSPGQGDSSKEMNVGFSQKESENQGKQNKSSVKNFTLAQREKERDFFETEEQVGFVLSEIRKSLNDNVHETERTTVSPRYTRLRTKSESSDIQALTTKAKPVRQTLIGVKTRASQENNSSSNVLLDWLRKPRKDCEIDEEKMNKTKHELAKSDIDTIDSKSKTTPARSRTRNLSGPSLQSRKYHLRRTSPISSPPGKIESPMSGERTSALSNIQKSSSTAAKSPRKSPAERRKSLRSSKQH
ncbi:hypothetical protein PoB_004159100 [Plakobranchus ocellatus]|uniref:Uncharacterized protein n=1 Tax=Plakobranchus ocellatus TaxID=259542 RepID=A0AAV4AVG0_9GAST|nr:hypothetical protein PoB_004159100 [Plakobranchus ocellatus]